MNVIPFDMPPLRERKEDIPVLVSHFLASFCAEYGKKSKETSPEALERLISYGWPGNVRELKKRHRAIGHHGDRRCHRPRGFAGRLVADGERRARSVHYDYPSLASAREAFETYFIRQKLTESKGNVSRTAESLGIERSHLYRKMKAYGIK